MSVRFDEATGRLQLDQAAFAALGACASGLAQAGGPARDADLGTAVAALRAAGVLIAGSSEVHPLVAPALRAVASPVRRLLLRLAARPGHAAQAAAWIDEEVAALLVDRAGFAARLPDQARGASSKRLPPLDLLAVHPSFLPAVIARLIGLGERLTVPGRPADGRGRVGAHLDAGGADGRRSAGQESTIRVWCGSTPADERVLRVRGTGMGWRIDGSEAVTTSRVTTSTEVWAALTRMLGR